ncbi:putative major allergen alt protein [Lasiodiplodia theobromae]|uniref:Effector protein PevD1 n=1 Tax=Lasiodiplodia theobromae TaxID=45133 RepID=A0A5N5CVF8_9PEZI|nr:Major allergen Alt [Lasiodiplodia theobromae]KAB2569337.1 Effector protein PevD1 [Lasiodiplodia theobromae]KAF4536991.1 Major allergen Alt [Lasiodiplodia theobromae]KAF9636053.1 putative major allergen alt protein [Lasiodiplodia theobromae]
MRFTTVAAFLGAVATATAATTETVTVKDLSIRDNEGIQSASFKLAEANVECSDDGTELKGDGVAACGETKYRFGLTGANSQYKLTVYKELGTAFGIMGTVDVQPYCHAGGNGANDFVCTQVSDITVTLA